MIEAYMNWSGGKDSAYCLYQSLESKQYHIQNLLTSVNAVHDRISMHGVRRTLLEAQSQALGIPLQTIELPEEPDMNAYEDGMMKQVNRLKNNGCTHAIFGDIFLEDLRKYREAKLKESGISCAFPLWKVDTAETVKKIIALGFKAIIVCVNEKYLGPEFCGRTIDESFLADLPEGVDPCGENGEFHSFVFEAPIFNRTIPVNKGEMVRRSYKAPSDNSSAAGPPEYGFYFCDLLPAS